MFIKQATCIRPYVTAEKRNQKKETNTAPTGITGKGPQEPPQGGLSAYSRE